MHQAPWTDIVHSLIDYKLGERPTLDPYSNHGSDMVVLYLDQHLKRFRPSKSWQRSRVVFDHSILEEEIEKPAKHLDSQLLKGIEAELNSSYKFERNLEAMIMNESYELEKNDENEQSFTETKDIIDKGDVLELSSSFHYPVVSMVSPNLGLIAGSRSMQQRVNQVVFTKKRPQEAESLVENTPDSVDGQVKKKLKKTMIKSHLVQSLHEKAEAELNLSDNFEQKL